MTIKYTLSIEDRVGTGANVTERAVIFRGYNDFTSEAPYNPNAQTKPFNSKDTEFDTSFSIVHSFIRVAKEVIQYHRKNGGVDVPTLKYDCSVEDAQKKLFGNLLKQFYQEKK